MNMLPVTEIVLPHLASNVPAFLAKLWKMVDDPETDQMISWGETGNSFVIHNQSDFTQSMLPYYYKHSNMASFVRQLNMYGFHKVVGVEAGGLKSEKDQEMEFAHPCFLRGQEILLTNIKRKVAGPKAPGGQGTAFVPSIKSEKVTEMLNEVTQLKDKQEDMDGKLDTMKKENEALWREVVNLRQKHMSQQKIVNKLIQFLVSIVQPRMTRGGQAVKRKYTPQLAIEATGGKSARYGVPQATTGVNPGGPVILDVTHDDDPVMPQQGQFQTQFQNQQQQEQQSQPQVEVPMSPLSMAMQAVDPALVNPSISVQPTSITLTPPSKDKEKANKQPKTPTGRPVLQREISKEDFDIETMLMQKDLDNLKDVLSGQITLDSSIISNLFSPDEPLNNSYFDPATGFSNNQQLSLEQQGTSNSGLEGVSAAATAASLSPGPGTSAPSTSVGATSGDDYDASGVDTQPGLFELADIEDDDDDAGGLIAAPRPPPTDDSYPSLETPLINVDDLDTNPLLAQIRKGGRKGKTPTKK